MWSKEYKVGATRVGLQKINPKERDNSNSNSNSTSTIQRLQLLSKNIIKEEKKVSTKDHFFASLQNQNARLHAFARFLVAETTMVKVGCW